MYDLLGLCLTLAALLCVNAVVTLFSMALWRLIEPHTRRLPARSRASLLFVMRVLPALLSIACALTLLVPSYVEYEPQHANEPVSVKLALIAFASLACLGLAFWRGLAAWLATRRLIADWMRHAERVEHEGLAIPAYRIRHPFPVVALVGLFRPRLFVAAGVLDALGREELSAALAHETGHLAAHDNLRRWLLRACRDLLAVVPCGRALDKAWAEAAEAAADERAVAAGGPTCALDLASALVKIARLAPEGARPNVPAGAFILGDDSGGVVRRVRRLTQLASRCPARERSRRRLPNFLALVCPALLLITALLFAANAPVHATVHAATERIVSALK
ncbi:MAG TPA: M48 family metalloprotease [Pyrinomonadaceae bacterium]